MVCFHFIQHRSVIYLLKLRDENLCTCTDHCSFHLGTQLAVEAPLSALHLFSGLFLGRRFLGSDSGGSPAPRSRHAWSLFFRISKGGIGTLRLKNLLGLPSYRTQRRCTRKWTRACAPWCIRYGRNCCISCMDKLGLHLCSTERKLVCQTRFLCTCKRKISNLFPITEITLDSTSFPPEQ